jgi:hypothetical protein
MSVGTVPLEGRASHRSKTIPRHEGEMGVRARPHDCGPQDHNSPGACPLGYAFEHSRPAPVAEHEHEVLSFN